jgi:AraC family transcriptional regulator
MFATRFPDLKWLKEQAESRSFRGRLPDGSMAPTEGLPTVILNVQTQNIYRDNIPGPLSLFSNWTGTSQVTTEGRTLNLPDDCFVLTNPGQRYTLTVGTAPAETFNIHFGELWAKGAISSLTQTHEWLTNQGNDFQRGDFGFYNKLFRKTEEVRLILRQLQSHAAGDSLRRDELLMSLLAQLMVEQQIERQRKNVLGAVKGATRSEIMRRLYLATDYVYSSPDGSFSLDELSRMAMLSKFHFLRSFKEAFNKTPHQFITEVRVERAKHLLGKTDLEIAEIARKVGFDEASVFSRRFRNCTGLYPTQYRAAN